MPKPGFLARAAILAAGLAALAMPAAAQQVRDPIATYTARISNSDKYNSNGVRLTSVAAILRQDRANLYVFGKGDREDERDPYFSILRNRATLERLVRATSWTSEAANAVRFGNPLVEVSVFRDRQGYYLNILVIG